jgi:hypothetical protein
VRRGASSRTTPAPQIELDIPAHIAVRAEIDPVPVLHVRTEVVPLALRALGTRVWVAWRTVWPEPTDGVADLREAHATSVTVDPEEVAAQPSPRMTRRRDPRRASSVEPASSGNEELACELGFAPARSLGQPLQRVAHILRHVQPEALHEDL